jgi:hypothetical protein
VPLRKDWNRIRYHGDFLEWAGVCGAGGGGAGLVGDVQMRARLKLQPKANWPIVEATIQPGGLGTIIMGRQGNAYAACFLGYGFEAVGIRRAGLFALYGDGDGE